MTDALGARAEAAVRGYRETGDAPTKQWWASPSVHATRLHHLLPPGAGSEPGRHIRAFCGEGHPVWWPVERFVRPEVFAPCPVCARMCPGDV